MRRWWWISCAVALAGCKEELAHPGPGGGGGGVGGAEVRDMVPMPYAKIINQPHSEEMRAGARDEADARHHYAEALSRIDSTFATFTSSGIEGRELVVQYASGGRAREYQCNPGKWAAEFSLELNDLEFSSVRCAGGPAAAVPDDGGRAKRNRFVERLKAITQGRDIAVTWHESEPDRLVVLAPEGSCGKQMLRAIRQEILKRKLDATSVGFAKLACSVDEAELPLR